MLNELWTIIFSTATKSGSGVVVINSGQILGGNSGFTFRGAIDDSNGKITGQAFVNRFNMNADPVIPGALDYKLSFDGSRRGSIMNLTAHIDGYSSICIAIRAHKINLDEAPDIASNIGMLIDSSIKSRLGPG